MINNIVVGERGWLDIYASTDPRADETWVKCKLSNGTDIYSCVTDKIDGIKKYCQSKNAHIVSAGLQFRSNSVKHDTSEAEAVYIVKSVRGQMGARTIYCIVIGTLDSGVVNKVAYCTPELIEIYKSEDKVEDCFEEMLIYNEQRTNKE